ncbi:MAG: alpha/beta hydrolase [Spirochaetes bacterium]|nr:alpha/beta hydrolase [Spirochaetota bacterium]
MEKHKLSDLSFIVNEWPINSSNPALLFIHTAGATAQSWTFQINGMGDRINIIAVDLPGHGDSSYSGQTSISDYADSVIKFIKILHPGRCIPAGIGMGAAVVQQMLADYPDMFTSAVLINTGAKMKVLPNIIKAIKTDSKAFMANLINFVLPADIDSEYFSFIMKDVIEVNPKVILRDFSACDNFDIRNRLNEIKLPVLIISSENDTMTPAWYGRYLNEHIKNSSLKIIPEAGHLINVEKSEMINSIIADFITDTG